jgi:hypothetical protein
MKPHYLWPFLVLVTTADLWSLPPGRYWPLDPGNRWTYVMEEGSKGSGYVVYVMGLEGDVYLLNFNGTEIRVGGLPDALDIELPGEGMVPYYRFQESSWLHRDFRGCDDKATITAAPEGETIETPAGTFENCLRLDYSGAGCMDAGKTSEWWSLDVGCVKWTQQSIGGPRSWVLASRDNVGQFRFLRGDANIDGKVDLSDAVFALNWLFTGGPAPGCLDPADSNDDGEVDIADPISLLGYLFLGSRPPPAPGPRVPGFDGTPDDPFACGDPPLFICDATSSSTLPGVRFDVSENPCVITLEQATGGVSFNYRTEIDADLPGVSSIAWANGCDPQDASGLSVLERIQGGDQAYCLCDVGRCMPRTYEVDLFQGTHESTFAWHGRNWSGPSDTGLPEGDPFPAGTYEFTVEAKGTYRASGGGDEPFEISASVRFHLIP